MSPLWLIFSLFFGYKAMTLLSNSHDALPQIYLVTDGSVDDERNICHTVKTQLMNRGPKSPRVSTFGLGNISNYFRLYHSTGQAKLYWQISVCFSGVMYEILFCSPTSFYQNMYCLS